MSQEDYQANRIDELPARAGLETTPKQQAEGDFADCEIKCANINELTIYCLIMVLGYSRHMYVEFIDKCTVTNFLSYCQHAFGFFRGISEKILYGTMKNVVVKRMLKKIQWNKEFEAFAMHYGYKTLLAPTYSPCPRSSAELKPFYHI